MLYFLFGFSLCLNFIFIIFSYFIYKNYKLSSPNYCLSDMLNKFYHESILYDIRKVDL